MSSSSLSQESSEQFITSGCRTLEMCVHVLIVLILQGEVSETIFEPWHELSTAALGAFHGAMMYNLAIRSPVVKD
jgi:hypothetical protein